MGPSEIYIGVKETNLKRLLYGSNLPHFLRGKTSVTIKSLRRGREGEMNRWSTGDFRAVKLFCLII
jgi:hypothetical protein